MPPVLSLWTGGTRYRYITNVAVEIRLILNPHVASGLRSERSIRYVRSPSRECVIVSSPFRRLLVYRRHVRSLRGIRPMCHRRRRVGCPKSLGNAEEPSAAGPPTPSAGSASAPGHPHIDPSRLDLRHLRGFPFTLLRLRRLLGLLRRHVAP